VAAHSVSADDESDPYRVVAKLEQAVSDMQARAAQLARRQRDHRPTIEHPFVVVLVDEVAFLTASHPDKNLRDLVKAALATLTTRGAFYAELMLELADVLAMTSWADESARCSAAGAAVPEDAERGRERRRAGQRRVLGRHRRAGARDGCPLYAAIGTGVCAGAVAAVLTGLY
jgi:hypothetical protein